MTPDLMKISCSAKEDGAAEVQERIWGLFDRGQIAHQSLFDKIGNDVVRSC